MAPGGRLLVVDHAEAPEACTRTYTVGVAATLRVSEATRDAVNRAARETASSADAVVGRAVQLLEDELFWRRHAEAAASRTRGEADGESDEMQPWERASAADLDEPLRG